MTHMTTDSRRGPGLSDIRAALLAALRGTLRFVGRLIAAEIDRRRTMALMGADEHMLRDLGISRSDIAAALLTEAGEKPSDRLSTIRDTNRIAERAQVREARRAGSGTSL